MIKGESRGIIHLDIYFDYRCPYVYRAAVWLQRVKQKLQSKLVINWRYFSLEQVNSQQGPQWKTWEHVGDYADRGLRAFWAAEAARLQGEVAFEKFHISLLKAKHEQQQDIDDINTLIEVGKGVNLKMARFQKDMADRRLLVRVVEDHTFAVENLGVFGTPTLVFPQNQAIFLKLAALPPAEESLSVFHELYQLADQRRYIQEIKRPVLK